MYAQSGNSSAVNAFIYVYGLGTAGVLNVGRRWLGRKHIRQQCSDNVTKNKHLRSWLGDHYPLLWMIYYSYLLRGTRVVPYAIRDR